MAGIKDRDLGRFFDGGSIDGSIAPRRDCPPSIHLDRRIEAKVSRLQWLVGHAPHWLRTHPKKEVFALDRRIGYQSRLCAKPHYVPAGENFRTDLTSVPDMFTWLVPRTGRHLPAALLHDGLVHDPNSHVSYVGDPVTRAQADRIFRDAMFDLGTGLFRRWLMWSAVTLATIWAGATTPTRDAANAQPLPLRVRMLNWYYRVVAVGTLATITVMGTLATFDLFDRWNGFPWMGDRSWTAEIAYGFAAAVITALVLSLLWYPLARAGAIAAVALAVLFHVTVAILALTAAFQGLDYLSRLLRGRSEPRPGQPAGEGPEPGSLAVDRSAVTELLHRGESLDPSQPR